MLPGGQMAGAGMLAGIGFTMSIFIAALAFEQKDMQDISKLVVMFTAVISIATLFIWMTVVGRNNKPEQPVTLYDDDEAYLNFG